MPTNPNLSESETIIVEMDNPIRLLEKATQRAISMALDRFGIDDCGHSSKVKGWSRSSCSIRIKFEGLEMYGGMRGWGYVVKFTAWCERSEDEE